MSAIDNLISIAAERKIFLTLEKIILLSQVIISLNKIINSFKKNSSCSEAPQKVHIQRIGDILYKAPHFFDDKMIEDFFNLKNDIDSEVIKLPLENDYNKSFFKKMKETALEKRKALRKKEKKKAL